MPETPTLNRDLFQGGFRFPPNVSAVPPRVFPERVIQFGAGGFLRGFVDWMIHRMNHAGHFQGSVVVCEWFMQSAIDQINAQNGLYTQIARGKMDGRVIDEREVISSISRAINPATQFDEYLALAGNPQFTVIVSNTTEAGIVFRAQDRLDDRPQASFPGKLTRLLWERYSRLGKGDAPGFVIVPCELIERNGDELRRCVEQMIANWNMPAEFAAWVKAKNVFCVTLVDRIVTGYPKEDAEQLTAELGYRDGLLNVGEPFHLWAIEADQRAADALPLEKAGLNVVFTDNLRPYRDRKVRILNGGHTMTVLAAYLMGLDTVGQCMDDALVSGYLRSGLDQEVIPTLDLPKAELDQFAAAVLERFANPFVRHTLLTISLNSVSKWKARLLPSLLEYAKRRNGQIPERLAFAMASLICFYRVEKQSDGSYAGKRPTDGQVYQLKDDAEAIEAILSAWRGYDGSTVSARSVAKAVLSNAKLWDENLDAMPGLTDAVGRHVDAITRLGARQAMASIPKCAA
jgi:tagaturonate reductase